MMKLFLIVLMMFFIGCNAKTNPSNPKETNNSKKVVEAGKEMEVACATCIYKMEGVTGCKTAIKVEGKATLLKGKGEGAHDLGLCGSAKKAMVVGKIKDGVFMSEKLTLKDAKGSDKGHDHKGHSH